MRAKKDDIVVKLHLEGKGGSIDPKFIFQALEHLEVSVYASDRLDISDAKEVLNLPSIVTDASLERLRKYRHNRIHFIEAKTGSIELIGVIAGVSYFILKNTVGEALKESFKETDEYEKLKTFFKKNLWTKARRISNELKEILHQKKRNFEVKLLPPATEQDPIEIVIDLKKDTDDKNNRIDSFGDMLD